MKICGLILVILFLFGCRQNTDNHTKLGDISLISPWEIRSFSTDKIIFLDKNSRSWVLLGKGACDLGYNECMIGTMRGIKQAGFNTLFADDVTLNNNRFVYLVSENEKLRFWSWLCYRNQQMYLISCGGSKLNQSLEHDCDTIASSITVDNG
jgi:hypothetical protein